MHVECPHCGKQLNLKQVKPGRFKPKCSKCEQRFRLTISEDGSSLVETLEVSPAAAGETSASANSDIDSTAAIEQTALGGPSATKAAEEVSATIATPNATAENRSDRDESSASGPPAESDSDQAVSDFESTAVMRSAPGTRAQLSDQTEVAQGPAASARPSDDRLLRLGQVIGGYRVEGELGRGAMGAVYLANQLSLDRLVGMKVIQKRFAADPVFIARFTREAYAAAQISHHNVVQIIDLGCEGDVHYFTMEYVRGQTLDELIRERGKLDAEAAVGFILQAARGLHHAHNLGMVHRDIKPANLMLSETGAVKVADLGLVKMLRNDGDESRVAAKAEQSAASQSQLASIAGDVTDPNLSMGTPLFMAPEQAQSAAHVDHRADIYSLGCTLYVMLTGKPPFVGASAMEVITKHRSEPVTRPDVIHKRVPGELSDIVMRMVAKQPEERYPNLGELIADLERFLGVKSGEPYSPDEADAEELEQAVAAFNRSKFAKLRGLLVPACVLGPLALAVLMLIFSWSLALGLAAMSASTMLSYFTLGGLRERTYLFDKVRSYLLQARLSDWLMWSGGGLLLLLILWVLGYFTTVIVLAGLGVAVGAALHFVLDAMVTRERGESLTAVQAVCRRLRLKGVEEDSLQQFVAKYAGEHWEEIFEAIFGYEEKLAARRELAKTETGRRLPKYRSWRDVLIRRLDARLKQTAAVKQQAHLQQIEEANLRALGMDQAEAREQAARVAEALVDEAAELRDQATRPSASQAAVVADPAKLRREKQERQKAMLADARSGKYRTTRQRAGALISGPLNLFLGGKVRFLIGCLLLAGFALWLKQNGLLSQEQLQDAAGAVMEQDLEATSALSNSETEPLALPLVGQLFNGYLPGLAGLLLVGSSFFRGWRMSVFLLPAAGVALLGPTLGLGVWLSGAVALGLAVGGLLLGRTP